MKESTQKILEKLIINHVPNDYTVNYWLTYDNWKI